MPFAPAAWRRLGDRLGHLAPPERAAAASMPALWVHAASVGELAAVHPLVAQLRARFPGRLLLVTTTTRTGLARARAMPEAHVTALLPLDAPGVIRGWLGALRLDGFHYPETEIWPTRLYALAGRDIRAILVSGRVSARTAARARWLEPLYRRALAGVTCCMQTGDDAARIVALGADPRRVQVAGSLKFEAEAGAPPPDVERAAARLAGRPVLVAGSTHAGEDEILLDAVGRLADGHPGLVLLLAPRHPERLDDVERLVAGRGMPCLRWSALLAGERALPAGRPGVVLLDVMGVLAHAYALGAVAFVGGSLVPVGGHNVLEPARLARPVLVGPHTATAAEGVDRLLAHGGALRVSSAEVLALAVDDLLADPARAADMGRRAATAVSGGQGALERHMKIVAARLEQTGFARAVAEG
jgi:3-deoxy-D-manno-octulosonic-acid transferase